MPRLLRNFLVYSLILFIAAGCAARFKTNQDDSGSKKLQKVALYFLDNNGRQLVLEERELPADGHFYETILKELIKGPAEPGDLPVIRQDMSFASVERKDDTIIVNFKGEKREFLDKSPLFIDSMVLTMTQLEGINKVRILVDGVPYDSENQGYYFREVRLGPVYVSKSRQGRLRQQAESGEKEFLYDPVETARKEGGALGFLPSDDYKLVSKQDKGGGSGTGEAYVEVRHGDRYYTVQLIQPFGTGEKSIWLINSVSRKITPIPEADPARGEVFIYGRVKSIDVEQRIIHIEREYMDSRDAQIKAGPDIYVLPEAIIHYQEKIGVSASGYDYSEYDVGLADIKPGDELGIIITKDKKARAIIISGRE
jgi:hypothetical protein